MHVHIVTHLIWEVMGRPSSVDIILRTQLQRSEIHQDKVPTTSGVYPIKRLEDTVRIVRNGRAGKVTVGQKRAVSQVICTDPESVHRVIGPPIGVDGVGPRLRVYILGVGQESGNLVPHHIRERELDVSITDVSQGVRVIAERPRDGVIVVLGF